MEVILLERVARLGPDGRRRARQGRLCPQFPAAARQGVARHGGKPHPLRDHEERPAGALADAQDRSRPALPRSSTARASPCCGKPPRPASCSARCRRATSCGLITRGGFPVNRNQIALNAPIKTIGQHNVPIALHPEIETSISVIVARNSDEAARIARGEDVTGCAKSRPKRRPRCLPPRHSSSRRPPNPARRAEAERSAGRARAATEQLINPEYRRAAPAKPHVPSARRRRIGAGYRLNAGLPELRQVAPARPARQRRQPGFCRLRGDGAAAGGFASGWLSASRGSWRSAPCLRCARPGWRSARVPPDSWSAWRPLAAPRSGFAGRRASRAAGSALGSSAAGRARSGSAYASRAGVAVPVPPPPPAHRRRARPPPAVLAV